MFGYSSYLDKSMNGIKTISDGVALIQNGNATFNTINVETITSSNLTDCNLINCTTNDPTSAQSVANKEYCDDNFVDRTNNLMQNINGLKTFTNNIRFNGNALFYATNSPFTNRTSFEQISTGLTIKPIHANGTIGLSATNAAGTSFSMISISNTGSTFTGEIRGTIFKSTITDSIHSIFDNLTSGGSINFGTSICNNVISGPTTLNQNLICSSQATFNNFTPISSVATPTAINHLTRKDYVDTNFLDRVNNLTQSINGAKSFSENVICSVATPTAINHLTRKDYVDTNFVDRTNNLAQNINGLKTFTNNTNVTASLLARTNIKLSEYENSPASNTITLTFPMPETIALRTTALTNNNMTVTLPTISNNERGYVFTFNKILNPTYGNFNVTFQTSGGNFIFTLLDIAGSPTSNTTLLSIDKIQCKLAVGFFGATNYWIEQTDFSTYDRFKLQEWQNPTATNSLTLSFPLPPTIALRASTASTMTVTLPSLTTNDRGKIFTFVKLNTFKFDVVFNTSSSQIIFPLNSISGSSTTNSTIFPSTKATTRLAVGWFGATNYWIEVSDYSTFDVETNNGRYVDFTSPQAISGAKSFNTSLPTSTLVPNSPYQLVNKIYTDTNFQLISNMNNYVNITSAQNVAGVKSFSSLPTCSVIPSTPDQLINKNYSDTNFQLISNMTNYVNISNPQSIAGVKTFSSLPLCSVVPSTADQLVNKNYVDGMPVHQILNSTNAWTGFNSFNTNLPTSTITPTTQYQLVNKNYVDGMPVHQILNSTNAWTGFNSFNTNLPTSTITPTTLYELVNKNYVDGMPVHQILNSTNAWTGFNSFNTNLPTSTIIPTTLYQLVNKNYTDTTFQLISNMNNYVNITSTQNVAGVKTFSSLPICSVVPSTADQLINKLYSDTKFQLISNMTDYVNITAPQNVAGVKTFSSLPLCTVVPSTADQLVNKNYTDTKFQLISNMSNYLTTTAAASTYLTQTNAASTYLTTTTAATTYINFTTDQQISAIKRFNGLFCTTLNITPTLGGTGNKQQLYVTGNELAFVPIFNSNTYTFYCNDSIPTQTSPLRIDSTNTTIANNLISNGQATFNNNAPVSNTPPTLPSHLTTKSYVDSMPVHGILSATNAWTGFNSFNTNLPTTTKTTFNSNEFVSKAYVDGMPVHGILNSTNAWTGFNSFNTNLPTSTITATTANQLVNFTTLTTQGYTTLSLVQGNANTFTNTNAFTGDVTLSKTKNNSSYAIYNALGSTYIGYMTEVPAGGYVGIGSGTQYQLGAITLDSTNVGFWTCNYEVEINCSTAGSISKIYVFVSNNNVSTTVPIGLPGAKANNFSTQTYAVGDSTYHSGSFSFLQSTSTVIYGVQLKVIVSSGGFQRKGQIRMLRIL